jgi:hypothetical protein
MKGLRGRYLAPSAAYVALVLILVGCAQTPGILPTYDPGPYCSLAELATQTVHIDPYASPPTWTSSYKLEWPAGFRLDLNQRPYAVVDRGGQTIVRDGQQLIGAFGGTSTRGPDWFAVCGIGNKYYTTSGASGSL